MSIKVQSNQEKTIVWIPKGDSFCLDHTAVVIGGEVDSVREITRVVLNRDIDGVIEFLQAIKKAMEETKE